MLRNSVAGLNRKGPNLLSEAPLRTYTWPLKPCTPETFGTSVTICVSFQPVTGAWISLLLPTMKCTDPRPFVNPLPVISTGSPGCPDVMLKEAITGSAIAAGCVDPVPSGLPGWVGEIPLSGTRVVPSDSTAVRGPFDSARGDGDAFATEFASDAIFCDIRWYASAGIFGLTCSSSCA